MSSCDACGAARSGTAFCVGCGAQQAESRPTAAPETTSLPAEEEAEALVEHSPAVSGVGPAESAQDSAAVTVYPDDGVETCRTDDSLLQQSGEDRAVSCNCALCNTPRRRMAWACCCCSVFIIILSFFLALYLPITALLNGAKLRLVHVNVTDLCSNPMVLQFRAQVTNPAQVHVDVGKLQVVFKKGSERLMDLSIPEPLAVPGLVDNQDVALTINIAVSDQEAASAAVVDMQANKWRGYTLDVLAVLDIRIIAIPIHFEFKDAMDLEDMMTSDDEEEQNKDNEGSNSSTAKWCFVNTTCWVTTFENECCEQAGNLSRVRFLDMQDEVGAMRMQAEAELVSPLVRVAMPSLSAAVFLHKQSDAQLPSDSSPVVQMAIKPADMPEGDARALMSAGRGEVSVLEEVLKHVSSLMASASTSAESAMAATAKMQDTDHSSKCQLQRLVSKLEVRIDLAAAAATGAARRATQHKLTAPAAASDGRGGMAAVARQASAALVSLAASAQEQVAEALARTLIVPAGGFPQAQAGSGEALYERAAEKEEEEEETRRQEGNRRNTWLPDGVITRSGATAKYGFKEYKETGASAVDVLLTMTNILGFPVGIKTGKYVLQCYAPPVSTSSDQLKLHPVMSITVKAVDERVRSRDELLLTLTVTFDNHTRVGHNVLSPALLGKSLLILPEVDTARGDLTMLSKGIRTVLESQDAIKEGIKLPAMQKAPVILIVDLLSSIQVSESPGQLVIDLSLEIRFPGASLLIPFKIPGVGLKLIDEDGAVRTDVNLEVQIEFSGITVDLKTRVKDAATRCNKLLSAVAFNAAAKLAGNVSIGTVLDPFPVVLDMASGLWVQQSSLDCASAAVAATHAHDSSNWCGFTGIQVSGARVCNYQNRSLEATVSNVTAMLSDKAAAHTPLTDRFVLLTSGQKFDGGECVALPAATSTSEYASTAGANASCAAHRKGGGGAQTLAIAYPEMMLGRICTCKAGINKCSAPQAAKPDAWDCLPTPNALKLCVEP